MKPTRCRNAIHYTIFASFHHLTGNFCPCLIIVLNKLAVLALPFLGHLHSGWTYFQVRVASIMHGRVYSSEVRWKPHENWDQCYDMGGSCVQKWSTTAKHFCVSQEVFWASVSFPSPVCQVQRVSSHPLSGSFSHFSSWGCIEKSTHRRRSLQNARYFPCQVHCQAKCFLAFLGTDFPSRDKENQLLVFPDKVGTVYFWVEQLAERNQRRADKTGHFELRFPCDGSAVFLPPTVISLLSRCSRLYYIVPFFFLKFFSCCHEEIFFHVMNNPSTHLQKVRHFPQTYPFSINKYPTCFFIHFKNCQCGLLLLDIFIQTYNVHWTHTPYTMVCFVLF